MYFKKSHIQNGLYVLIVLMIVVNIFTLFLFVSNFSKGDLYFDFEGLKSGWGKSRSVGSGVGVSGARIPAVIFDPSIPSLRFRVSKDNGKLELIVPEGKLQPSNGMISIAQRVRDKYNTIKNKKLSTGNNNKAHSSLTRLNRILSSKTDLDKEESLTVWDGIKDWPTTNPLKLLSLPPAINLAKVAPILQVKASGRGTQLKLEVELKGGQLAYFKPQFYSKDVILNGTVYGGKDRHFGEIAAFYLNLILGYYNGPIVVGRNLDLKKEIMNKAKDRIKETFYKLQNGSICFYGVCTFCKESDPVCSDEKGRMDGALVLLLDKKFKTIVNPWRRTYKEDKLAPWEASSDGFCEIVLSELDKGSIGQNKKKGKMILDIVGVSIFDFLIGNGDRHHFEISLKNDAESSHSSSILLIDNGKSFGNAFEDYFDILAPLFQCCRIRKALHETLQKFVGSLGESLEEVSKLDGLYPLLRDSHLSALDRRLNIVLVTVQLCLDQKKHKKVIYE